MMRLLKTVSLALALISSVSCFTPVAKRVVRPVKLSNPHHHHHPTTSDSRSTTALFISWPGQEDTNKKQKPTSEGKRDTESRLQLSGEASEASMSFFDIASTKDMEELVSPVSKSLDDLTGGWALSYANLEPENETTPIGISFLATNIAYGMTGFFLTSQGNALLGVLTELACVASFFYHYSQLKFGQGGSQIVRLALLVDYVFAISAIVVGSVQLLLSHQLPTEALYGGSLAVASLGACWIWEEGLTYIFLHSLWHLFSAYTGYVIGSCIQQ